MNVGLLTSQASMNYGGILQAAALKKYIQDMGHTCTVINYIPEVHDISKHPIKYITERKNGFEKAVFVISHFNDYRSRKAKFEQFKNDYLSPEPREALNTEQLAKEIEKYDIVCCGSDQLWNLNQKDNENRAFMLDFPYRIKSFSYAVSFGDALKCCPEKIDEALPLIRKFSGISVREEEGRSFLSSKGINATLTVDPTLLIDLDYWNGFIGTKPFMSGEYIFCYGYENAYQGYAEFIAETLKIGCQMGLPIVNVLMNPVFSKGFINKFDAGPIEFLDLIKNAKLVCTNSFHGTIFSHRFGTPFCVISSKEKGLDGRKKTLLKTINQEWRAITDYKEFDPKRFLSSSELVTEEECMIRNQSADFLKGMLDYE